MQIVLDNSPTLGESHQSWQVNETNKLIWPSPDGVGMMDGDLWIQTIDVATSEEIIGAEPEGAYRTDIAEEAVGQLSEDGIDVTGDSWEPVTVEFREGGE